MVGPAVTSTMPASGSKLGKGACGVVSVYRGLIPLAQKVCSTPETCGAHLDKEAELLATLHHENIVKYVSYNKDQKEKRLFLEYIDGVTLAQRLENNNTLAEPTARYLFRQLLSAVNYLHNKNIAHLDIKAENTMITNNNVLKLIDFGLAENLGSSLTKEKVCCGTPDYIAPEVFHDHTCSIKADMWSIGVLLFKSLTGHFPFACATIMETRDAIKNIDFRYFHPAASFPQLSPECYSLLSALLSRKPEDRPSAAKVLEHPWFAVCPVLITAPHTPAYNVFRSGSPTNSFYALAKPTSVSSASVSSYGSSPYTSPFSDSPVGSPMLANPLLSSLSTLNEEEDCEPYEL